MGQMRKETTGAVLLAAGAGRRMGTDVPKQYLPLLGKPVMAYALEAFENSPVDQIVVVVAPGEQEFCRRQILEKYHITKAVAVVEGGRERYDSVYLGLQAAACDYVLIHDCARAFITEEIISRCIEAVKIRQACVAGVPSKDTVKIVTEDGFVDTTPPRSCVWNVQTPQCFSYPLILEAYQKAFAAGVTALTDDAMVVETMTDVPVQMVMGSYENVKITTPEDLILGEQILTRRRSADANNQDANNL
jgi:2-C-methyl-D-erythritol 4-phosphate cytidylyltransferase